MPSACWPPLPENSSARRFDECAAARSSARTNSRSLERSVRAPDLFWSCSSSPKSCAQFGAAVSGGRRVRAGGRGGGACAARGARARGRARRRRPGTTTEGELRRQVAGGRAGAAAHQEGELLIVVIVVGDAHERLVVVADQRGHRLELPARLERVDVQAAHLPRPTLRDDLGSFLRAEPESTHVESSELRLWGGGGRFAHLNVRIQRVEELPARLPPLHVLARRVGRQCARLAHHLRLRGAVE